MFVEGSSEIVEVGAGVHADRQIAWIVMGDLVKTGHVEGDVITGRWHADFEFGATAARNDGKIFECGEAHNFGDLFSGCWFGDGGRHDFVYRIVRADGRICSDVRRADSRSEARSEVGSSASHRMPTADKRKKRKDNAKAQRVAEVRREGSCRARTRGGISTDAYFAAAFA